MLGASVGVPGANAAVGVLLLLASSLQIDDGSRGFSFMADGPIDMRMDPAAAALSAEEVRRGVGWGGRSLRCSERERHDLWVWAHLWATWATWAISGCGPTSGQPPLGMGLASWLLWATNDISFWCLTSTSHGPQVMKQECPIFHWLIIQLELIGNVLDNHLCH
jgi:hypothetical protein